jgi:hypothetical protein
MGGSSRHQSDCPQAVSCELISDDEHIARTMHGLHADKRIADDVVGNQHMIAVQIDSLSGILDVVADDPSLITDWSARSR